MSAHSHNKFNCYFIATIKLCKVHKFLLIRSSVLVYNFLFSCDKNSRVSYGVIRYDNDVYSLFASNKTYYSCVKGKF